MVFWFSHNRIAALFERVHPQVLKCICTHRHEFSFFTRHSLSVLCRATHHKYLSVHTVQHLHCTRCAVLLLVNRCSWNKIHITFFIHLWVAYGPSFHFEYLFSRVLRKRSGLWNFQYDNKVTVLWEGTTVWEEHALSSSKSACRWHHVPSKSWYIPDYVSHQKTVILFLVILIIWILTNRSRAVLEGCIYSILPGDHILLLYVLINVCCEGLLIYCAILYLLKEKEIIASRHWWGWWLCYDWITRVQFLTSTEIFLCNIASRLHLEPAQSPLCVRSSFQSKMVDAWGRPLTFT